MGRLVVPVEFLRLYGCGGCVWKGTPLCRRGFVGVGEGLSEGFCDELASFLVGLAGPGDGLCAVREKFLLYVQEFQAQSDRVEFLGLLEELRKLEGLRVRDVDEERRLGELRLRVELLRTWWARLSEGVVKGLSRVVDREARGRDAAVVAGGGVRKITVQQLNVLLKGGGGVERLEEGGGGGGGGV